MGEARRREAEIGRQIRDDGRRPLLNRFRMEALDLEPLENPCPDLAAFIDDNEGTLSEEQCSVLSKVLAAVHRLHEEAERLNRHNTDCAQALGYLEQNVSGTANVLQAHVDKVILAIEDQRKMGLVPDAGLLGMRDWAAAVLVAERQSQEAAVAGVMTLMGPGDAVARS